MDYISVPFQIKYGIRACVEKCVTYSTFFFFFFCSTLSSKATLLAVNTAHALHWTDQTYLCPNLDKTPQSTEQTYCPCLNPPVCVCVLDVCLQCRASLRLLFEDVIALLLSSSEWPGMDLCGLFSSQWPVQIVNRSPMNCGFSGFVSLQTRFCR